MALTRFSVQNNKAIKSASCEKVPRLMIIAGPNGVGKSTLLFAIRRRQGATIDGKILYLAPHRIWRRQTVQMSNLLQEIPHFGDLLQLDALQGFAGMRVFDGSRTPDSADETFGAIKHTLSKFETRKQTAVNVFLKREKKVTVEDIGNIYAPLEELTQFLLPHLKFHEIDLTKNSDVRVLFTRTDRSGKHEVELDDLSSGERSLISLFMPFLETEIDARLNRIEGLAPTEKPRHDIVVLIDEPEIHLHPYLQARMVEYLRAITSQGGVQFILTTHSTTIIEAADYDELFVLNPPMTDDASENQLVQLATTAEKLCALRALTGDTHALTVGRKLLCIEGELPSSDRNRATDVRLLELMCPEITTYVVLPFGGKANTIQAAERLRALLPAAFGLESVLALVDKDTSDTPSQPWIHHLGVAMVENLLLQPAMIWDVLSPHKERLPFSDVTGADAELNAIASARREEELSLRVERTLPFVKFRPRGTTLPEVTASYEEMATQERQRLPKEDDLSASVRDARTTIERIVDDKQMLELFHGKEILQEFHKRHVERVGMAYQTFCLQLARAIGRDEAGRKHVAAKLESILPPATTPAMASDQQTPENSTTPATDA